MHRTGRWQTMTPIAQEKELQGLAPGAEVFDQVGDEIRTLADATLRLQSVLGEMLVDSETPFPTDFLHLQEIDRITQTLGNLAQFMHALHVPEGLQLDTDLAAKYLPLKQLADRLRAAGRSKKGLDDTAVSGDLDLF